LKYAWDIFRTMLRFKCHGRNLFYDRRFDTGPAEETYDLKLGFPSSHTIAIAAAKPGVDILDIGCGRGYVAEELAGIARHVTGIDRFAPTHSNRPNVDYLQWDLEAANLPVDASQFDQIYLLDIVEHLKDPEIFMETLRGSISGRRAEIVMTTPNVAFIVTRLMLLFGHFNYGRKGILDRTHTRLFTLQSLRELLDQTGYEVLEIKGVPAPFPRVLGDGFASRVMLALNQALIMAGRGLFAYQIFIRARARPTVENLLHETETGSAALKRPPR